MNNSLQEFLSEYKTLIKAHQNIVLGVMRNMKHEKHSEKLSYKWYDYGTAIQERQKELGLTDEEVVFEIVDYFEFNKDLDSKDALSLDTYRDIRKSNPQKSKWYKYIAEVLDTTVDDLKTLRGKDGFKNLAIILNDYNDIEWLFDSLEEENKNAINYLISELKKL